MLVRSCGLLTSVSTKNKPLTKVFPCHLKGLTFVERVNLSHRISLRWGSLSSSLMSIHMKSRNFAYLRTHLHQKIMQCERTGPEEQEFMPRVQCSCCKYLGGELQWVPWTEQSWARAVFYVHVWSTSSKAVSSQLSSCAPRPFHSNSPSVGSNENWKTYHKSSLLTLLWRFTPSSQMFCRADIHTYECIHKHYSTTLFPQGLI